MVPLCPLVTSLTPRAAPEYHATSNKTTLALPLTSPIKLHVWLIVGSKQGTADTNQAQRKMNVETMDEKSQMSNGLLQNARQNPQTRCSNLNFHLSFQAASLAQYANILPLKSTDMPIWCGFVATITITSGSAEIAASGKHVVRKTYPFTWAAVQRSQSAGERGAQSSNIFTLDCVLGTRYTKGWQTWRYH